MARRTHKTNTHGLSAAEFERLTTWMPELAGAVLGHVQPDGDGFRVGDKRALVVNAGASFHDFRDDKHGYGPLALIQHLNEIDADGAADYARQWLASHAGEGQLAGANDRADGEDAEADIYRQAMIEELWSSAQPIKGTPAEAYLISRGLKPSAEDLAQLRWLPDFRGPEGAMLAAIRDNAGELVGLQMTFITPSGQKSTISPVRRTHKGPHNWGSRGAVRFGAPIGKSIFICEGVEDALSVRATGHGPVLAILGINRLGRIALPDNIEGVVFVRDDDPAGSPSRAAMARGLVHLLASGRRVLLTHLPSAIAGEDAPPLKDINDLLQHDPSKVDELLVTAAPPLFNLSADLVKAILEAVSLLPAVDYERAREAVRKMLGLKRVKALDDDRKARIANRTERVKEDGDARKPEDVPWHDPVTDLGALMDAAVTEISHYIIAPAEVIYTVVFWSVFAHIIQHEQLGVDFAPRLAIQSATTICGKSTLLECVACLVPRDRISGSITTSSIFRIVDSLRPTLLIDEGDNFIRTSQGQEAMAVLNSGHRRRTAFVERVERRDDGQFEVARFSTFTAIAFASIKLLPETLQNRSIVVVLRRALSGEKRKHLRGSESSVLFELRRKLIRWALDLTALPDVELDPRLENRQGDNWYWLFRIAEEAGGDWPGRALAAAISADDEAAAADQNEVTALLAAIWDVFATRGVVRIETQTLIDDLLKADEGRWQEAHRGKPITPYYLRECLKMVIPNTKEMERVREWKEGSVKKHGYAEILFEDAWLRYLKRLKPSAYKKNVHSEEGMFPSGTSGPSGPDAENTENTNTSANSDEKPSGLASGAIGDCIRPSGPVEDEQNQDVNSKVPDGPDDPDGRTLYADDTFPRGGMRRRKPNGNGVGDRS